MQQWHWPAQQLGLSCKEQTDPIDCAFIIWPSSKMRSRMRGREFTSVRSSTHYEPASIKDANSKFAKGHGEVNNRETFEPPKPLELLMAVRGWPSMGCVMMGTPSQAGSSCVMLADTG
jgi:hypothetical protein